MNYGTVGRVLVGAAIVLAVVGIVLIVLDRLGVSRLPGDLVWRGDGVSVYIPIGLMILVSVLLTILLNLLLRR